MDNKYFYGLLDEAERPEIAFLPTVCALMEQCRTKYENRPAVNDFKNEITYGELYDKVGRLRGYLKETGLKPGAHIGLVFRNDAMFILLFLAAATSGRVPVPLHPDMKPESIGFYAKKLDIDILFCADEFEPLCAGMHAVCAKDVYEGKYAPPAEATGDMPCAIFLTGGTTGIPKGALLSHKAMMRGAFNGTFIKGSAIGQRYYALIPFSHVFGLIRNLMACLYTGSLIYTCTDMRNLFSDLAVAKPSIMVLVPAIADMLLGAAALKGKEVFGGNLKTIICGGAPVHENIIFRYAALGILVHPGYGLTETANLVSGNGEQSEYPSSVGRPYSAQELKIVNGELHIKGENLMTGYYNDPEETEKAFEDGWFKTGDLASLDGDGRLYITGRTKNVIILPNGENVSPEEIERMLYKIPFIKDCLVAEGRSASGAPLLQAEILPNMPVIEAAGENNPAVPIQKAVDKMNEELPACMRVGKIVLRTKDFKRSPSMKIVRE